MRSSLDLNVAQVQRATVLTRDEFEQDVVSRCQPMVLENLLAGSLRDWTLDHFAARAPRVPIAMDRRVRIHPSDASQRSVTVVRAQAYARGVTSQPTEYAGASVRSALDDVSPGLAAQLAPRPFLGRTRLVAAELYSGLDYSTAGHCHPKYHVLLCHTQGTKNVVLYPPSDARFVYPHPVYTEEFATSRVDYFDFDSTAFPLLASGHRLVARLVPGDALFLPVGYWHAVNAPGLTTSVSFCWLARTREQRSLRASVRNHVGWAISRGVEGLAPSIGRWPGFARAIVSRYHPTAAAAVRGDRARTLDDDG
jgi:hypothetical protein